MTDAAPELRPRRIESETQSEQTYTVVTLEYVDTQDDELLAKENRLNALFEGIYIDKVLTAELAETPITPENITDEDVFKTYKRGLSLIRRRTNIMDKVREGALHPHRLFRRASIVSMQANTQVTREFIDLDPKNGTVNEQLDTIDKNFELVTHDIRKSLTPAFVRFQFLQMELAKGNSRDTGRVASLCNDINNSIVQLNKYVTNTAESVALDQYPKEPTTLTKLTEQFQEMTGIVKKMMISEDMQIDINPIDEDLEWREVEWSRKYSDPLFVNLIVNASEQYDVRDKIDSARAEQPRIVTITLKKAEAADLTQFGLDVTKEYAKIVFADEATGLMSKTVGNLTGESEKGHEDIKGTGTALKNNKEKLAHYGGTMTLVDKTDVKGAEVWVYLPLIPNEHNN